MIWKDYICEAGFTFELKEIRRKQGKIFVRGRCLFWEAISFLQTVILEEKIVSKNLSVFSKPKWSVIFRKTRDLKIGEYYLDIPQSQLGNIKSRQGFRPIATEQK